MKTRTTIVTLAVTVLALTPLVGFAKGGPENAPKQRAQVERGQRDLDRDRLRDRDRISNPSHDRDRIQDRTHAPDSAKQDSHGIYGSELMSEQERNAYRKRVQDAKSDGEREGIKAQHRHEMQVRAKSQGVVLDEPAETEAAE